MTVSGAVSVSSRANARKRDAPGRVLSKKRRGSVPLTTNRITWALKEHRKVYETERKNRSLGKAQEQLSQSSWVSSQYEAMQRP